MNEEGARDWGRKEERTSGEVERKEGGCDQTVVADEKRRKGGGERNEKRRQGERVERGKEIKPRVRSLSDIVDCDEFRVHTRSDDSCPLVASWFMIRRVAIIGAADLGVVYISYGGSFKV